MVKVNRFEDFKIGDKGEVEKTITAEDLEVFAGLTLDNNPNHMDDEFAKNMPARQRIVHGMLLGSLISAAVGTKMPGPGSIWIDQNLKFVRPVMVGDTVKAVSELLVKVEEKKYVI